MNQSGDLSLLDVSFRSQSSQKQRQPLSPAQQTLLSRAGHQTFYTKKMISPDKRPELQIIEKQRKTKKVLIVDEFNPKDFIMPGVSEKDVEIYKEIFDNFSISRTGMLTPMDVRNALESLGYHPKKNVVYQIVSEIDSDESGGIDFKEFLDIVTGQTQNFVRNDTSSLREVFKTFDETNRGFCTKKEFTSAAKDMGEELSKEKVDKIFALLSPRDPEKLSFDSFCKFIRNWKAT